MPMNEQPPWGQKKKPVGTEEQIAALIQKIRDLFAGNNQKGGGEPPSGKDGGEPSSFSAGAGKIAALVIALLILQGLFSCFYTIKPGEVGVMLRFGEYNRTTDPGLHFKIPYVEELVKVDVETVRKEEFGFRNRAVSGDLNADRHSFDNESLMLTGDKNVIEVAWIVQYKVSNPVDFLFKVRDVPKAVRDASETVTRRIVGNMDFDYVLSNREILAAKAKQELQAQVDRLECGVNIVTLQLLDINPPEQVKPAFNEVNEADQDMKRLVNEAEGEYNRVIPKARGSAKQIVEEAQGYAIERVNRAKGETNRFLSIVKEYEGAETVTRQRMHLEAMEAILPKVDHLYILDKAGQNTLPIFNLSRKALKGTEPAAAAEN